MLLLLTLLACEPPADGPNVLLVIIDDIGTDKLSVYDPSAPPTPNLEALAAEGLRFDRAYADPYCSPTRAGFLTGRHGYRYGIGTFLTTNSGWSLPEREKTLPEALRGYESAAVGKFHVGGPLDERPYASFAVDHGFDHYEGAPDNLMRGTLPDGEPESYFHYDRLDDDWTIVDDYATTDVTDTALRFAGELSEPWLLQVGYHGAHRPFHAPPDALNPLGAEAGDPEIVRYDAMVASLDLELGRLLDGIADDTLIFVVGDNGTPSEVKADGLPGKGTVSEGGTHVPLIVAGPGVAAGTTTALVSHVDLFATILDAAGLEEESDGRSFLHVLDDPALPADRDHVYAEVFEPRGPGPYTELYDRMVRDDRYKLVRTLDEDRFYDLEADPREEIDLLGAPLTDEAKAALDVLAVHMWTYAGF